LELSQNLLTVGGKAAVIVPNGVLFSVSKMHPKARKILIEINDLQAVISMPSAGEGVPNSLKKLLAVLPVSADDSSVLNFYLALSCSFTSQTIQPNVLIFSSSL